MTFNFLPSTSLHQHQHHLSVPSDFNYSKSPTMKVIYISFVLAVCSLVSGGLIGHHPAIEIAADSPPHYEFQYSVHDAHTGDIKDQFEHRRGDYVTGRYSLIEPDGQRRIVDYSADPLLGFSAQVRRELVGGIHASAPVVEAWPAPTHRR